MDRVDHVETTLTNEFPEGPWTVAQLNREIEAVLNDQNGRFPTHVVGEVADVNRYGFGTFFELSDLEGEPVISCLAWSRTIQNFESDIEAGAKAVVEATVDFHPDGGDCRLMVDGYWPLGESKRQLELEELKQQLAAEGLFDDERKQTPPPYPATVGLVTSPSGSAREDVWAAITDQAPQTDVKLHGATVQGDNAVPSQIEALTHLDNDPEVEVIILTRGGGSDTNLWCFNAEPLVRCVSSCRTPVIVAIGHEDDETVVEYVADIRAMTPTEAGVMATTDNETLKSRLASFEHRITRAYGRLVETELDQRSRRIDTAFDGVKQEVTKRETLIRRANDIEHRITRAYKGLVTGRLDEVEVYLETAFNTLEQRFTQRQASVRQSHNLERRIDQTYTTYVNTQLDSYGRRIETAFENLEQDRTRRRAVLQRANNLERRIDRNYAVLVDTQLDRIETRVEKGVDQIALAAEARAASERVARGRIRDLEKRIDAAYKTTVEHNLSKLDQRIADNYRELEANARVQAGTKEARRLRALVIVLLGIILLGSLGLIFVFL